MSASRDGVEREAVGVLRRPVEGHQAGARVARGGEGARRCCGSGCEGESEGSTVHGKSSIAVLDGARRIRARGRALIEMHGHAARTAYKHVFIDFLHLLTLGVQYRNERI